MMWSEDDPFLLAFFEKSRLRILDNDRIEDRIETSCRFCRFTKLEIEGVDLDRLMTSGDPGIVDASRLFAKYRTKTLKETEKLLDELRFEDAWKCISMRPHRCLWERIADRALRHVEFDLALRAFYK